jgi:hypothetical protein
MGMVQAALQGPWVCREAVRDANAERQEQNYIEDEKDFADSFESGKSVWLLAKERRNSASTHGTFEPRPGEVIQALAPWKLL